MIGPDIEEALRGIGLSKNASAVYAALLRVGRTTVTKLQAATGFHSQVVYNALEELGREQLVSFTTERGRRYFQPAPPQRLLDRERDRLTKLETVLPQLMTQFQRHDEPIVFVYSGNADFQRARQTVLRSIPAGGTYYALGAGGKRFKQALDGTYRTQELERIRRGVHKQLLDFEDSFRDVGVPTGETEQLSDYRYIPGIHAGPVSTLFGGDYLRLNLWTDPVLTILIKNRTLVESYTTYFNLLWERGMRPQGMTRRS